MRARVLAAGLAILAVPLGPARAADATDVAGVPKAIVGVHGPTQDFASGLTPIGKSAIVRPGTTKPLGNNGAPALIGDCLYLGRWHDYTTRYGIQIVDVSDPAAPAVVGSVLDSSAPGGVAREIRAVDLPGFTMLTVMQFAEGLGDRVHNKLFFYTFPTGDCRAPALAGTFDMRAFRGHEFYQWLDPDPAHDVDGHPRVLVYVTAPVGPPNILVVDASRPTAPQLAGVYDAGLPVVSPREEAGTYLGTYAHSISLSPDGTEAYVSYWDGGFFTLDTTSLALGLPGGAIVARGAKSVPFVYPPEEFGNTHSAVKIPGTNTVVVGDEIYISTDGCPFGWMRTIDIGSEISLPRQVGEFRLAENRRENCDPATGQTTSRNSLGLAIDGTFSMHNQTVVGSYAFVSWYGGGLRVIDVSDPASPHEVGVFVPQPVESITDRPSTGSPTYGDATVTTDDDWWVSTWSYPVIRDGKIYVADMRNGLFILEPAPGAPFAATVASTAFAEGNSNLGAFVASA